MSMSVLPLRKLALSCMLVLALVWSVEGVVGPNTLTVYSARWRSHTTYKDGRPSVQASGELFVDKNAQVLRIDGDMSRGTAHSEAVTIYQGSYRWRIRQNVTMPNSNITCHFEANHTSPFLGNAFEPTKYRGVQFWRGRLADVWDEVPTFGGPMREGPPVTYYEDHFEHKPLAYHRETSTYTYEVTFSDFGEPPADVTTFTVPKHITCDGSNENNVETRPEHIPPRPSAPKNWETWIGYTSADGKVNGRGFFATSHDANAVHWRGDFYNSQRSRGVPPSTVATSIYHDGKLTNIYEHDDTNHENGPIRCTTTVNDTNPWVDLFNHHAYHKAKYMGLQFLNNGFKNAQLVEVWHNVSLPSFGSANFTDILYIDAFNKNPVRLAVENNGTTLFVNFYDVVTTAAINADLFLVPQQLKCTGPPASGLKLHRPPLNPHWHSYFFQRVDGALNHTRDFGRLFVDRGNEFFRSDNSVFEQGSRERHHAIHIRHKNFEWHIDDRTGTPMCTFNWNVTTPVYEKDPFRDAVFAGVRVKNGRFVDVWDKVHLFQRRGNAPYIDVRYHADLFTHELVELEFQTPRGDNVTLSTFVHSDEPTSLDVATVGRELNCRDVTPHDHPEDNNKGDAGKSSSGSDQPAPKPDPCVGKVENGVMAGVSVALFAVGLVLGAIAYRVFNKRKAGSGNSFNELDEVGTGTSA